LNAAGIPVTVGVLGDAAAAQNRPFVTLMRRRRPFVTLKAALSADAKVAAAPGLRTPLTSDEANRVVHRERAEVDAIAVGSGTVLADDPRLTAREVLRERPLIRVVFDRRLRTPPSAMLFSTLDAGPVIIVSTPSAAASAPDRRAALESAGARIELVGSSDPVGELLQRLGSEGVSSLVVEGGPTLHRAFWDAALVDRVELFLTPHALGPGGLAWLPLDLLAAGPLAGITARPLGADIMIETYVHRPD
jgi:diaminohydroxyphosphoribosylaminopyrimidine deaminase/5-amino-6-(5-phosphoribosylamino)uracil reductase